MEKEEIKILRYIVIISISMLIMMVAILLLIANFKEVVECQNSDSQETHFVYYPKRVSMQGNQSGKITNEDDQKQANTSATGLPLVLGILSADKSILSKLDIFDIFLFFVIWVSGIFFHLAWCKLAKRLIEKT